MPKPSTLKAWLEATNARPETIAKNQHLLGGENNLPIPVAQREGDSETFKASSEGKTVQICLDYPPTTNNLYETLRNGKRRKSTKAREYESNVLATWCELKQTLGFKAFKETDRLRLTITLFAKDKRRRDIDNIKIIPDALAKAGVYPDDSQIDELKVIRGSTEANRGCAWVEIEVI